MDAEIINFLSLESEIPIDKITSHSTLLGDLKLDGDDAWAVFDYCHKEFNLDLSNFKFSKYFRSEPCLKGITYLYRKLKYSDEHLAASKQPITEQQFIESCKNGKW